MRLIFALAQYGFQVEFHKKNRKSSLAFDPIHLKGRTHTLFTSSIFFRNLKKKKNFLVTSEACQQSCHKGLPEY